MSRNPQIEAIHAARYEWETAGEKEKRSLLKTLFQLLDESIAASGQKISREELLDLLKDDYREFKKMKRRESWARLKK